MFFWQSSGEVEEEIAHHRLAEKGGSPHGLKKFLYDIKIDTTVGMIASEIAQWFIIITTATVLFSHGITNITSASDAAKALEPLVQSFPNAGQLAKDLFAVGIIGLGLLGIPVLAGSAAYAMSEAFGWKEGLYRRLKSATAFYGIIIISVGLGMLMNFAHLDPIKTLIYAAVLNGLVAPIMLVLIVKLSSNSKVMGTWVNGKLSGLMGWLTVILMGLVGLATIWGLLF